MQHPVREFFENLERSRRQRDERAIGGQEDEVLGTGYREPVILRVSSPSDPVVLVGSVMTGTGEVADTLRLTGPQVATLRAVSTTMSSGPAGREAFRREQQSTIKVACTFPVLSILQRSDFSAERIKVRQK